MRTQKKKEKPLGNSQKWSRSLTGGFKRGFTVLVVARAGRLQEWSQGKPALLKIGLIAG